MTQDANTPLWTDERIIAEYHRVFEDYPSVHLDAFIRIIRDDYEAHLSMACQLSPLERDRELAAAQVEIARLREQQPTAEVRETLEAAIRYLRCYAGLTTRCDTALAWLAQQQEAQDVSQSE